MAISQYASALPFAGSLDTWVQPQDAERLAAYRFYEDVYWNEPGTFALVQRGTNAQPLYIPSGRSIIEATNRFLAKSFNYAIDPRIGSPNDQAVLDSLLRNMFAREKFFVKFGTQKRFGLIRGDAVWQIVGDGLKDQGSRISIYEVDPASYFPIEDPDNPERIIGVYLVDQMDNGDGTIIVRRQAYRKGTPEDLYHGPITYDVTWWETDGWDDRPGSTQEPKPTAPPAGVVTPDPVVLDGRITSIPVYHVKNFPGTLAPFGSSELRGFETIVAGVNQRISDQDLALALEGLGMYVTTSSPPVDENGNETTWKIGPGYVAEIDPETDWKRVQGVGSQAVQGSIAHMDWLKAQMQESSGTPDIAIGRVDVNIAESGIALQFKMAPILAKNEEKEQEILAVMDHMLYDITHMWLPVYEAFSGAANAASVVGDPLPVNRTAVLDEVIQMLSTTPPLISAEYARTILQEKLGYDFPADMANTVVAEAQAYATARNVDPFLSRAFDELNAAGEAGATGGQ